MSPSGKAVGFGPAIRGFESYHPSHTTKRSGVVWIHYHFMQIKYMKATKTKTTQKSTLIVRSPKKNSKRSASFYVMQNFGDVIKKLSTE
jgi:hypothetical protein